jgi:parvulin-like peptidyl-prolyl isomerase
VNLKRWIVIGMTALALVACGSPAVGTAVARVDNVILSQQELDQRLKVAQEAATALATKQGQPGPSADQLKRTLVEQFVQENLVLNIARQRGVSINDKDVDDLIAQIKANIQGGQSGLTIEDAVHAQLGLPGVEAPEFRQFISSLVAQRKLAETLVTTDTVRAELTTQMMSQASQKSDQVHAAHILVETEDEATKVLDRLTKGEQFDALAKELSKDTGSGANGGDLGWIQKDQTVPEFNKAIFEDLKPGEMTKTPVKTQFGYHIIKVLEREQRAAMTEDQAKQAIEQGLPQELQSRRSQALQQLITGEREKAKAENRLVEPVFAEPTPEATPGQAPPEPTAPGQALPEPTAQP